MSKRSQLKKLVDNFSQQRLVQFFRSAHENFKPIEQRRPHFVEEEPDFLLSVHDVGEIELDLDEVLIIYRLKTQNNITSQTSKKRQYELAKKILKEERSDAGIFVFHDNRGHFRFSLVVTHYDEAKRQYTPFRRYTYYVTPKKPNKTFVNQIGKADFSTIDSILKAFSIEAVSEDFYNDFKPKFDEIAQAVEGGDVEANLKEDFALLFIIRIIFLGFVQKKGWLGNDEKFLQKYWKEYKSQFEGNDDFYSHWLKPLFFEALNSPPGRKVKYQNNEFSGDTETALQQAPYLNGDLFKKKKGYDNIGLSIPDEQIGDFFDFLFQYNFTIEENRYYDEELELNPEFLGLIFERLVNKEDGAIYTPRTEVDFMCRMALVKWLQKNTSCDTRDLYHLFFREMGSADEFDKHQKHGDFSQVQLKELIEKLETVTACDPAAGSGAFEVGMMHVLHEVLGNLYERHNKPDNIETKSGFELKKAIIAQSLYGVEVKEWAVWINHLRLWLTMFIDMPDEEKDSPKPLLPSLNFKVRCGDSLVQRIGSKLFPVQGHAHLKKGMKQRITKLKQKKIDFFHNRGVSADEVQHAEFTLFRDIIRNELDEKRQKINILENRKVEQANLDFGLPEPKDPQQKIELYEKEKQRLQEEIDELEEQERNLAEQHPLVWNIEFAEIFYDRGGFDIIIGNPPYVRQEDIADPTGQLEPKTYKDKLTEMVRMDYPRHFKGNVKISGRSDLYTYFYIRSLHLLNQNGTHVFICSNSWLDVGYGHWLQYFLLRNVPVHLVVDNHAKRSFVSADVNTVITVMGAPKPSDNNLQQQPNFVAFKRPFEEVILTENLLDIEDASEAVTNDRFRTFPITKQRLLEEGSEYENPQDREMGSGVYVGDKWGGKYLRAPDIFYTILDKAEGKLIKLKEVGDIRFGVKTGCNEFFYLNNAEANEWQIEDEYLKNAVLKTEEAQHALMSENDVDGFFFWCDEPKEDLEGTKALEYIEWGEQQEKKITQGSRKGEVLNGYHEVPSVQGRKYWYRVSTRTPSPVWWMIAHNTRSVAFLNEDYIPSDNFFEILPTRYDPRKLTIMLSSTMTCFIRELFGRSNFGGGLLKTQKPDLIKFDILKDDEINLNGQDLSPFYEAESKSIFEESGIDPESETPISQQEPSPIESRKLIDDIVFDAIGLTTDERKEVYRAVCQLVWNRVSKAQSV